MSFLQWYARKLNHNVRNVPFGKLPDSLIKCEKIYGFDYISGRHAIYVNAHGDFVFSSDKVSFGHMPLYRKDTETSYYRLKYDYEV